MGVHVVLLDTAGQQLRALPDPAGGTFDSAGDFDQLLGEVSAGPLWSSIDPYDHRTLTADQVKLLATELPGIVQGAGDGPQRRGLERLRVMTHACAADPTLRLRFLGD